MKSKYGIGLFIFIFVVIYLSGFQFYREENSNKNTDSVIEESKTNDIQSSTEECYYLYEVNGYVVVYQGDKKTPYEYTDILFDELPELLQIEIQNGKYMKNVEELYGFLENYSS